MRHRGYQWVLVVNIDFDEKDNNSLHCWALILFQTYFSKYFKSVLESRYYYLFYRWWNWSPERLSKLSKDTELVRDKAVFKFRLFTAQSLKQYLIRIAFIYWQIQSAFTRSSSNYILNGSYFHAIVPAMVDTEQNKTGTQPLKWNPVTIFSFEGHPQDNPPKVLRLSCS